MPTIDRHDLTWFWPCPYCGQSCVWPLEAMGHLKASHSPSDVTPQSEIRDIVIEGEEDLAGLRLHHYCPFCRGGYIGIFETLAGLKGHLTTIHGCS